MQHYTDLLIAFLKESPGLAPLIQLAIAAFAIRQIIKAIDLTRLHPEVVRFARLLHERMALDELGWRSDAETSPRMHRLEHALCWAMVAICTIVALFTAYAIYHVPDTASMATVASAWAFIGLNLVIGRIFAVELDLVRESCPDRRAALVMDGRSAGAHGSGVTTRSGASRRP